MVARHWSRDLHAMTADYHLLAQLLTLAGLLGGTIEYIEIIKHRQLRMQLWGQRVEDHEAALQGLVRLFLVETSPPATT